ncbi:DUF898 family protein [Rhodobacterales bacterium HKCCE2091]|nr:DUF898 family protein [Rhodobacterales bacterium HKCCE2091]
MAILRTAFSGDRGDLFLLALKTSALTLVTFGLYRFWAKTRLRRWYWSSVRPGGTPLEYTGTPWEKLTGFLFAIVLLAIVLTLANLVGILTVIDLMETMPEAYMGALVSLPAVIFPLWFFARYRARRYILSRTRWRGIRFGMEPAAWGYAWRACMYWVLNICTLGLTWPLLTFQLEKYLTDRTWFGNARFTQHGSFLRLYGPLLPFLFCVWGGIALWGYFIYANGGGEAAFNAFQLNEVWALIGGLVTIPLAALFGIYYRVASIRVMADLKTLGDGIEFDLYPRTRKILKIYFFGWWKTYIAAGFVSNVVFGAVLGVLWLTGNFTPDMAVNPPINVAIAIGVLTYLMLMLMAQTFRQTFITYPLVEHIAQSAEIHQPAFLGSIRQRDEDSRGDAGGFADALDAGAAF